MKKVIVLIVCNLLVSQLDAYFIRNFMGIYQLWKKNKNSEERNNQFYAQNLVTGYNQENCEKVHGFLKKELRNCNNENKKKIIKILMDMFTFDSSWWKRWTNPLNPFSNKTSPPNALNALYGYLVDEDFSEKTKNEKIFFENQITVCCQVCDKLDGDPEKICAPYYQQKEKKEQELDELILQVYGKDFEDYHNHNRKMKILAYGGPAIVFGSLILWAIFKPRQ